MAYLGLEPTIVCNPNEKGPTPGVSQMETTRGTWGLTGVTAGT